MHCNTCRCGPDNALLCTKMACIDWKTLARKKYNSGGKNWNEKKAKRTGLHNLDAKKRPELPTLPDGPCVPGQLYITTNCRQCFCTIEQKAICSHSRNGCRHKLNTPKRPEDFRPPVSDEEFENLPELEHTAVKCDPGLTYKVDCNPCLCLTKMNLMCDHLLCLIPEETRKLEAKKQKGQPCKYRGVTEANCVRCTCNGTVLDCHPIPDCVTDSERQKLSTGKKMKRLRLSIEFDTDECQPNSVYRDDCNRCYCQPDKSLRCTQKTCLNYRQAKQLEKQRLYLKKHGL